MDSIGCSVWISVVPWTVYAIPNTTKLKLALKPYFMLMSYPSDVV